MTALTVFGLLVACCLCPIMFWRFTISHSPLFGPYFTASNAGASFALKEIFEARPDIEKLWLTNTKKRFPNMEKHLVGIAFAATYTEMGLDQRIAAVYLLGEIGDEACTAALLSLSRHSASEIIKNNAKESLAHIAANQFVERKK